MCRFWDKIGDFFGEKFDEEWNLDEMFAPFARWFFRTDFRTFHAFSHDFRTTCFFKVFLCMDFRTVSHDFRASKFFVRTFRACSHDLRTQAVGQRVCARFDRNQHKTGENHSFRFAHPKLFEFLRRKTFTN